MPLKKYIGTLDSSKQNLIEIYHHYLQTTSKHIVPEAQAHYNELLNLCDKLAQLYNGKIWGLVDYEAYNAKIRLTLPKFIEFINADELLLLKEIAEKARSVSFRATEEGSLLVTILVQYFAEDESYEDFLTRNIKAFIERRGLSLEEVSAQTDVSPEILTAIFGAS